MVKTITIMNDAYELLKKAKNENESFSDVIRKIYSKKNVDLSRHLGVLDKKEYVNLQKDMKKLRENMSKDMKKRFKKIRW